MPPRTFTRADLDASRALWDAGEFSPEWRNVRHRAAMVAGIIYPPSGDAYDSWDDDNPSQRAILIRAIRETPTLLDRSITPQCKSWSDVLTRLLAGRVEMQRHNAEVERWDGVDEDRPTHGEAVMALGGIVKRLADSVG